MEKMKKRVIYLITLYAMLIAVFVLQKTAFMLVDMPDGKSYGIGDWWNVVVNGLLLDIPMAGYLTALPLLVVMASVWVNKTVPLRRIATPYYIIVA